MMIAVEGTMKEMVVMSTVPDKQDIEFIEVDADDARHFGYLGPYNVYRFLDKVIRTRMAPEGPLFAEALTNQGWVECPQGTGIPRGSLAFRLYPAGVSYFVDTAEHAGVEFMHGMLLDEYLSRLTCPTDK